MQSGRDTQRERDGDREKDEGREGRGEVEGFKLILEFIYHDDTLRVMNENLLPCVTWYIF